MGNNFYKQALVVIAAYLTVGTAVGLVPTTIPLQAGAYTVVMFLAYMMKG